MSDNLIAFIVLIFIFAILFVFDRIRWRKIEDASRHEPTFSDLDYEWFNVDDAREFLDKLHILHGKLVRPIDTFKKSVPEGDILAYSINVNPGSSRSSERRYKLTIVTPNLHLPHFSIMPIPKEEGKTSGLSKTLMRIFPKRYRRNDQKPVQLGLDEEFEKTHVIKTSDEAALRKFLMHTRLDKLKDLRTEYIIECNETDLSIEDPAVEDQGWKDLVQAERDLREISWIFSAE